MSILVTGCTSGLGRFLKEALNADGWHKGELPQRHYDTIIHCAHDRKNHQSAMYLLNQIYSIPCRRFIYMSTIDVHNAYNIDSGQYGLWKLRGEQFVRSSYSNHLIIRAGMMLGRYSKDNSITRLLTGKPLTVTPESTFAAVRHESILPYIVNEENGTVNACGEPIAIREIAERYDINPRYGEYRYSSPNVSPSHETMAEIWGFVKDHMIYEDIGMEYGLCPV